MKFSAPEIVGNDRGFTLIELITVIVIIGILAVMGGYYLQEMRARYEAESQVKQMHVDMMNARARATMRNRAYFITITANDYQIAEDTNESGGVAADAGDDAFFPNPKKIRYPAITGTGTYVMDTKGIIGIVDGTSIDAILANAAKSIRFNTGGVIPEYDCLVVGPTRINEGKWNGTKCAPR